MCVVGPLVCVNPILVCFVVCINALTSVYTRAICIISMLEKAVSLCAVAFI